MLKQPEGCYEASVHSNGTRATSTDDGFQKSELTAEERSLSALPRRRPASAIVEAILVAAEATPMKCVTETCAAPAVAVVFWPGRVPPPVMCASCTVRAINVGAAMGLPVHHELLIVHQPDGGAR